MASYTVLLRITSLKVMDFPKNYDPSHGLKDDGLEATMMLRGGLMKKILLKSSLSNFFNFVRYTLNMVSPKCY
jgi:hypothetical protein